MSWITFDNLKRFWKGIRTNPVTFTGEIDLQNTTRYKGNEIATKADVEAGGSNITVDDALSDTSTNPVQNKVINSKFDTCIDYTKPYDTSTEDRMIDGWFPIVDSYGGISKGHIKTLYNIFIYRLDTKYAAKESPTFTGTVTAPNVTVSTSLTIPGGKIWIK